MTRRWRILLLLSLVSGLWAAGQHPASAHAALVTSDPPGGTVFDRTTPKVVRLSFSETPEPSLSTIEVSSSTGARYDTARPTVAGDPHTLEVPLKPIDRGVYTVAWRSFSQIDGHPTSGTFAFGVGEVPTLAATTSSTATPGLSALEVIGRWTLIVGLVGLVGVGVSGAIGYGGTASSGPLGPVAWLFSLVGLAVFADAQRRNAAAPFDVLLSTPVGHALVWRAVCIAGSGAALLIARRVQALRRLTMALTAGAAATAMAVHVDGGHAAAVQTLRWASVAAQWAHFAAVGVWIGGLLALLIAVRGAPSTAKTAMVRRFSAVAAIALAVVVVTGVVGAIREVKAWDDLTSTGYGRTILVKSGLIVVIAGLAAVNRWRNVRLTVSDLRPLRRTSGGEVVLATAALVAAALLAGLAPPAAQAATAKGLSASGHDYATTVLVRLTTLSPTPGPNRFDVRIADFDTADPVQADRVTLRFTAIDDPEVVPTELALTEDANDAYVGLGNNLAFEGRWKVDVLIERGATSVVVPLALETQSPPLFVSITRIPGQAPEYAVQMADENNVIFSPNPERPGPSQLRIVYADIISDERNIARIVVTATDEAGAVQELSVQRVSGGRFVADITLVAGRTRITAIARTPDGSRLWAAFELNVGGG